MKTNRILLIEALAKAGISYTTGYRLVLTGAWTGEKVDGRWVVDERSVRTWLAKHGRAP